MSEYKRRQALCNKPTRKISATSQKSLLLPASGKEFTLIPASIPIPGPGDVLVRNGAVAVNPVDWRIQNIPHAGANGRGHYKGTSILVFGGGSHVGANAIQLANLSGFAPIHTTTSLTHTARLMSLGAARVIDRYASLSDALAGEKLSVIVDAVATPATAAALASHIAPGGTLVFMRRALQDAVILPEGAQMVNVFGSPFHPANAETGAGLFASLENWLADGDIKAGHVEVLPGGLGGIAGGLARLEKGTVGGVKFVVRPGETA